MTLEEYQKYTEYRTYNFINNKKSPQAVNKFKKFIDPHNVMVEKNVKILSMLSFICCRFVRKVMFQAIREKSPESKLFLLEESIDPVYITKIGNQFIDLFCNKINQYITVKENKEKGEKEVIVEDKESEKAREIFVNQFIDLKYREVLPRKVVLNAQK